MRGIGELVAVDDEPERAVRRRERPLGDALDQPLGAAPVRDEIGDRADLQAVGAREDDEIGEPRHRAVGVHDLAEHGRRREPRERGQVAARLGVTGAGEHAARLRDQRKHVPGLHDVGRLGVGRGGHADRVRAVLRRDAGRSPLARLRSRR